MRVLLQRVQSGNVTINKVIFSTINQGLVIFLGIESEDTKKDAEYLVDKCVNLRIFSDNEGKLNLSAVDIKADLLVISQFTLYADCHKGRRPNFMCAAPSAVSRPLYDYFVSILKNYSLVVKTGEFGAHMVVNIRNDGPVTILLESKK